MKEIVDFVKLLVMELLMVLVLVVLKFVMGFLEMHDYEAFLIDSLAFEVTSEKINEMAFEMVIEMVIEMAFEMAFEMDLLAFVMGA